MVEENGGQHYSNGMYKMAQEKIENEAFKQKTLDYGKKALIVTGAVAGVGAVAGAGVVVATGVGAAAVAATGLRGAAAAAVAATGLRGAAVVGARVFTAAVGRLLQFN